MIPMRQSHKLNRCSSVLDDLNFEFGLPARRCGAECLPVYTGNSLPLPVYTGKSLAGRGPQKRNFPAQKTYFWQRQAAAGLATITNSLSSGSLRRVSEIVFLLTCYKFHLDPYHLDPFGFCAGSEWLQLNFSSASVSNQFQCSSAVYSRGVAPSRSIIVRRA